MVTKKSYEWDTGYKEDIFYMVLDEKLKVIQSNLSLDIQQFTHRELNLLTLNSDAKYFVYKYEFEEQSGERRVLLMHVKKMDRQRYKKLDFLWKIFIPACNESKSCLHDLDECREGQYPAPWGASISMPRCLRRGY